MEIRGAPLILNKYSMELTIRVNDWHNDPNLPEKFQSCCRVYVYIPDNSLLLPPTTSHVYPGIATYCLLLLLTTAGVFFTSIIVPSVTMHSTLLFGTKKCCSR